MNYLDATGLTITTTSQEAANAYDSLALSFLSHAKRTPDDLQNLLLLDPESAIGWSIKAFACVLQGRAELVPAAKSAAMTAETHFKARGGTKREGYYVRAARLAADGHWSHAVEVLEMILAKTPQDSLAAKFSHNMRFMIGDIRGMRSSIERIMAKISEDHVHAGFLLGCQSFAMEEMGDYVNAERVGRKAVQLSPQDAWGLHAVSHVFEMTGRAANGIEWLEKRGDIYAHCNNFSYHVFWHLALFRLELGDHDGVMALYDSEIRSLHTDDFRDIANAASLLTRLELEGVYIGNRWEELADLAEKRVRDTTLVFADLHYLLALLGAGRDSAAMTLTASLKAAHLSSSSDQALVAERVGAQVAEGLLAYKEQRYSAAADLLLAVRPQVQLAGGSHAQRDVFEQITLESVLKSGRTTLAERLLNERLESRGGSNRFAVKRLRKVASQRQGNERVAMLAAAAFSPIVE